MNKKFLSMTPAEQIFGWIWLVMQLFFLPVILELLNLLLRLNLTLTMLNVIIFTVDFIAVAIIFHRYLLHQLKSLRISTVFLWVPAGFALYWILSLVVVFLVAFLQPAHTNANNEMINGMLQQQPFLMTMGAVVFAPITEEVLFRGLLFGQLYKKKPILGYTVSVFVFAAVHVVGYIGQQSAYSLLVSLLQYIPAGLVLGFIYVKAETLAAPIMIHMLINLLATVAMR